MDRSLNSPSSACHRLLLSDIPVWNLKRRTILGVKTMFHTSNYFWKSKKNLTKQITFLTACIFKESTGKRVYQKLCWLVSSSAPKKFHLVEAALFGRLDQMLSTVLLGGWRGKAPPAQNRGFLGVAPPSQNRKCLTKIRKISKKITKTTCN